MKTKLTTTNRLSKGFIFRSTKNRSFQNKYSWHATGETKCNTTKAEVPTYLTAFIGHFPRECKRLTWFSLGYVSTNQKVL